MLNVLMHAVAAVYLMKKIFRWSINVPDAKKLSVTVHDLYILITNIY